LIGYEIGTEGCVGSNGGGGSGAEDWSSGSEVDFDIVRKRKRFWSLLWISLRRFISVFATGTTRRTKERGGVSVCSRVSSRVFFFV
jgi:hypothetical protein